jgi:NUMOD3 motif
MRRGEPMPREIRAKISVSLRGKTHTPETKAKIAASRRASWAKRYKQRTARWYAR